MEAVAGLEKIEATDEDLEKELDEYAEAYKKDKEEIRTMLGDASLNMIRKDIRNRKAVDFLYENAKFSEPKKKAAKAEKTEKAEKPAAKKTTKKADADKEEKPAAKKPAAKKTTKKAETSENTEA